MCGPRKQTPASVCVLSERDQDNRPLRVSWPASEPVISWRAKTHYLFFCLINVWFMVNVIQRAFQTHLNKWLDLTLRGACVALTHERCLSLRSRIFWGCCSSMCLTDSFLLTLIWLVASLDLLHIPVVLQLHSCRCRFFHLGDTMGTLEESCSRE